MGTSKFKRLVVGSFTGLVFFSVFTSNLTASNLIQDAICKTVFCGEGRCQGVQQFPYVDCICNPGWTKLNLISFPCVIPNCTVNFQCGNGVPPPPPPPPFQLPVNFSDPCLINFCGPNGTCERNGSDFMCQCLDGSANLLGLPKFPCFKKCNLGADCDGLDLGFNQPPPPSPPSPPSNSVSPTNGDRLNGSGKFHILTVIVLATLFLNI